MLSDQVLEMVFSFLEQGDGRADADLQLAAQPTCRLLQTRRMHGFDHVKLAVCRKGLQWAMRAQEFWKHAAILSQVQVAAPALLPPDRDQNSDVRYL